MILRKIFGDKSRFAVEVMHDPTVSGPHMVVGFFLYWVNDKWIGNLAYEYLTHTLKDMRDAKTQIPGHRGGAEFCALSPEAFLRWWDENLWSEDSPGQADHEQWNKLWDDHRRLWLNFGDANSDAKIYLLDCGGVGRLLWYPNKDAPAVVIEDDISRFETILKDAHDYMSALHAFVGYHQYLTDREHRLFIDRTAAGWHSVRARVTRAGDTNRSEAIADHVFLFRSDYGWLREQAHVRARLTGSERAADLRVEFPETDGIRAAADGDDPNGMEVHRAWVALGDSDRGRFPPGAAFHPELSAPLRQHLVPTQEGLHEAEALPWFSVQLRMAFMIDGQGCGGLVDYLHLVRAADFDAAFNRALAIGRAKERTRLCYEHPPILFQFVEVRALSLLGVGELGDAIEVHVEAPVARLKQDWTPLRDEESRAGMVSRDFELGLPGL